MLYIHMTKIQDLAIYDGEIVPLKDARLSITSSAVLYGLSVYSVVYAHKAESGFILFRLDRHLQRLAQSAKLIGFSVNESLTTYELVKDQIHKLLRSTKPEASQFIRITIHAADSLPGIKTKNDKYILSIFSHEAKNIMPQNGARIKTSQWRRTADTAIPARAKVNGAYVNSALAKQDAINSGYDDCLFLNNQEYVSELSAANIFLIKDNKLITPDISSDILEGITRRSIIEIAAELQIPTIERKVALTELYTANEVFACGTSAFVSPIIEIDNRVVGDGLPGEITTKIRTILQERQSDARHEWNTLI